MYKVLYRKYRPRFFADVVGQPQVTVTLKNELMRGRIAHAYLFCGTHGTGKTMKVLVIAKGVKADEAAAAGADYVGGEDMINKIKNENWFDFDVCVTTPDMMGLVGRIGKVLGPKGLMPNPKSGTVTMDVTKAVKEIKAGKVEYRLDKTNIIHVAIGKKSFGAEKLLENYNTVYDAILKAKPAAAKGQYVRSVTLTSTMGPGVKVAYRV